MHEKTLATRRAHDGRLLKLDVLTVQVEPGRPASREVVRHPGAVAVLARCPDGRLALVEQYRKPVEESLLEVVAGCLHPGEDPTACARRELLEETGFAARSIRPLGLIYPTPGYCDERLHLFFAELDGRSRRQRLDDDERVRVRLVTVAELDRLIARDAIRDAKTLAVLLKARQAALL